MPTAEAPPHLGEVVAAAEFRARLRRFARESERIVAAHGLTPRQYALLLMIKGAPGGVERSTVTELAERLQLERHTVTEIVTRAERSGLVARARSPRDGRVVDLRLTGEGERRLVAALHDHAAERERLLDALGAQPAARG